MVYELLEQGQPGPLPPAMTKDAGQSQNAPYFPNEHANNQIFFTGICEDYMRYQIRINYTSDT